MDSTSGSGSSAAAVDAALANSSVAPLHQQPGDKPRKTVHLIYDYMYEFAEDYRVHLPGMAMPASGCCPLGRCLLTRRRSHVSPFLAVHIHVTMIGCWAFGNVVTC